MKELHNLASFVHGALAFGHFLGVAYNGRRKNWLDIGIHTVALVYSARAAVRHSRYQDTPTNLEAAYLALGD